MCAVNQLITAGVSEPAVAMSTLLGAGPLSQIIVTRRERNGPCVVTFEKDVCLLKPIPFPEGPVLLTLYN